MLNFLVMSALYFGFDCYVSDRGTLNFRFDFYVSDKGALNFRLIVSLVISRFFILFDCLVGDERVSYFLLLFR